MGVDRIRVGTAGWSIPRASQQRFAGPGTHLRRYASVLSCVEINSSFHRSHTLMTYARWAASTPPGFRFSLKVPRVITHDQQLRRARAPLERFLEETSALGRKRGPLLVQLPPSLAFDKRVAARFFDLLRARHAGPVVCEPRHPSWFQRDAGMLLARVEVARVAADPAPAPDAAAPGGWPGLAYYRLHGSPRMYWSPYGTAYLEALARTLRANASREVWCVFDNTAAGAALENAWELYTLLDGRPQQRLVPADAAATSSSLPTGT
jgi:uncharacterized protein YecE (DUF72 family)